MKHIKITTLILLLVVGASSCEKFFDVQLDDQATLEEIFSESRMTRRFLAQIYSYIPMDEETVNNDGFVSPRSDEGMYSWYRDVNYIRYKTGDYSSITPVDEATHNYWPKFYKAINQCHVFLDNIHYNVEDTTEKIEYMKAEVRFLRAYFYFCLFRQYGPVYLWYDEAPDDAIIPSTVDRHTVEENIDWIVSELESVAEILPQTLAEVGEESRDGRVTKGAALALRSRVLLYAASPLYNGADIYIGRVQNLNGEFLFPQSKDASKWELAAQAALDVINLGLYDLYEASGSDAFSKGAASYQGVMTEPWNRETIWGWWRRASAAHDWLGGTGGTLAVAMPNSFTGIAYGYAGVAPSLKLVDTYPMWDTGRYPVTGYEGQNDMSRPIVDAASGYSASGFTDNYQHPLLSWAAPFKAHNSCIGRDPRFYASVVPNGFWWPNQNLNTIFTCYNDASCSSPWAASGDKLRVGYIWRRLYVDDTTLSSSENYQALNYVYPAFRMAEIYLNYAEACNEKPNRDENTAIEYLNKVRNRAGLNNIEVAYPEIRGDQELLRWCIQKERMVEFGLEAMRHYDACRWMVAKDEYPTDTWTLHLSASTYEESYERVTSDFVGDPATFNDKDYLFPISSEQLAEMTNLTQNYGH
ncbi:MAG: RagB/SusD family nutrient uptake outer membrane protein [Alistipes sp.]|nr:RagB/SusD family nutrient uptake outer membrane protein [Alistipes sp.]